MGDEVVVNDTPEVGPSFDLIEVDVQLLFILSSALLHLFPRTLDVAARHPFAFGGPLGDGTRLAKGSLIDCELDWLH